ncbi:MAG: DUF3105 domain-containing protein [Acidimicrobiales bacterium]|nr:DUF3105 domain-containing protein [Acidimicrobiales bacterium]
MRFIGVFALFAVVVTACGDDAAAGCVEVREPLDPNSIQHTLDPNLVEFQTDPPTSGPHLSGPAATGILDEPLLPAAQVNVLESGVILVQYDETIALDDVVAVVDQTTAEVVIAPGDGLPSPVVATAWTWKLTCSDADTAAIGAFADRRASEAPVDD